MDKFRHCKKDRLHFYYMKLGTKFDLELARDKGYNTGYPSMQFR